MVSRYIRALAGLAIAAISAVDAKPLARAALTDYAAIADQLKLGGKFNHTRCPAFWEMQTENVKKNFDVKKLAGFYYELAEHDYTQYPACPTGMRCVTSEKVVDLEKNLVNDTFTLGCGYPGSDPSKGNYPVHLGFKIKPNLRGFLEGYTNETGGIHGHIFPDTVVDFKEDTSEPGHPGAGQYDWALELQCDEVHLPNHILDKIIFIGINFYSKRVDEASYEGMVNALKKQGLWEYASANLGLKKIHHGNDCWYGSQGDGSHPLPKGTNWTATPEVEVQEEKDENEQVMYV